MINLEIPKKFKPLVSQANQVATEVFRPISRKYDEAEHAYPKELDMLASLIDGMNEGSDIGGAGAAGVRREDERRRRREPQRLQPLDRARHHRALLGRRRPAALDAAPGPRQLGDRLGGDRASSSSSYGGKWAAMAITEPEAGSDSAAIRTTAELDGDEYVLNGEKIFVTSGDRADLIVVWATLDRSQGPGGDQVVHRRARQPRPEARPARAQARDPRLRHRQLHPAGLPGAEGGAARRPRRQRREGLRRGDADLRQHAAAGRGDGGRRHPGGARGDAQAARGGRRRGRLLRARHSPSTPPRRASSRWRPTTRPPGC